MQHAFRCALGAASLGLIACASAGPKLKVAPLTVAEPAQLAARVAPAGWPTTRIGTDVDVYHGVTVADPYRWLEAEDVEEVKAWSDAQARTARTALDALPGRAELLATTRKILSAGVIGAPSIVGKGQQVRVFYTRREGTDNQPKLYMREGLRGADRVLLEPEKLSADATTSLDYWFPSPDGKWLAWGSSEGGSEESTIRVRNVATGVDATDSLPRTRHATVAWLPDASGFYYTRYPVVGSVPAGDEKYGSKVFFHQLGAPAAADAEVFGAGREKADTPAVSLSEDGRWLLVTVHQGWDKNEVYLADTRQKSLTFVPVAVGTRALYHAQVALGNVYIATNDGASRYQLYRVPCAQAGARSKWSRLIAESADVLDHVAIAKNEILVHYLRGAQSRIVRHALSGALLGEVALPSIGTASVGSSDDGAASYVTFTSFLVPQEVHLLNAGTLTPWERVHDAIDTSAYEVTRHYATSKDGTSVPLFVVARKNADGPLPTILYGYGGFNINQTPTYSARALATVASGGRWVTANLRGGGEFGEDWHRAGMREKKQNVFDDFIASAEYLQAKGLTTKSRLAILGGSNGGLLTSVMVTQRPDLFAAAASLVPLTDMLRYQNFRIARLWVPEFGSSEDPQQFAYLRAYSPYHNVRDGVRYPAMLLATAESDSRVDPLHARKMAARLQAAQAAAENPILLRIERKAGHGAGKPISKVAAELTDELGFLFAHTGLAPFAAAPQH